MRITFRILRLQDLPLFRVALNYIVQCQWPFYHSSWPRKIEGRAFNFIGRTSVGKLVCFLFFIVTWKSVICIVVTEALLCGVCLDCFLLLFCFWERQLLYKLINHSWHHQIMSLTAGHQLEVKQLTLNSAKRKRKGKDQLSVISKEAVRNFWDILLFRCHFVLQILKWMKWVHTSRWTKPKFTTKVSLIKV